MNSIGAITDIYHIYRFGSCRRPTSDLAVVDVIIEQPNQVTEHEHHLDDRALFITYAIKLLEIFQIKCRNRLASYATHICDHTSNSK
jgi:hypothetical protein